VSDDARREWTVGAAKRAFNTAWDLVDRAERDAADDAAMLLAAFGSRYLWDDVGGDEQRAIGDWQVAHVASLLGEAGLARRFAASCLERVEANGWTDWRLASALEGMSRAHAAAGDTAGRDAFAERCRGVLATIDDAEDRDLIAGQLATVPGLTG
jgi:hypothetical protein